MKLCIDNFAKISHAEVAIDGITVIAGENNTGKSTIGKILFSLFNSFSGIEEKILRQQQHEIERRCRLALMNYMQVKRAENRASLRSGLYRDVSVTVRALSKRFIELLQEHNDIEYTEIVRNIEEILEASGIDLKNTDVEEVTERMADFISDVIALPEQTIMLEILSRYFRRVFNGQINSLVSQETDAKLRLAIKDREISLTFSKHECVECASDITLLRKAIYIDNPFVVDKLSDFDDLSEMDELLKSLMTQEQENIMDGVIEAVLAKGKLAEVYQALQTVVNGKIVMGSNDEFYLEEEGYSEPISLLNLSTGLKSFVILKMLIEKGAIKEKDVLILDEPEIHLHPQWQMTYAELIVLLQKYFDLSVIVTTHSPYFLDAINLFSAKYGTDKEVNYYLSSMEGEQVVMDLVTENIDSIYKKMASPIQMLETLRYELNNR